MSSESEGEDKAPPPRQSVMDMLAAPDVFPDDGPVAARVRQVDHYTGIIEQLVLFGILAAVVLTGVAQAISTKVFGKSLLWSFDVVRAGTFAIAMLGAAYATQQARHLSMDIVSRFVHPRKRLIMRVVLSLFVIFASYLLLRSGLRLTERVGLEGGHRGVVPMDAIAAMIPAGAGLIIFHTLLHVVIDVDYLRRGKLPPEKAVSGH